MPALPLTARRGRNALAVALAALLAVAAFAVASPDSTATATATATAKRKPCASLKGKQAKACRASLLPSSYRVDQMGHMDYGGGPMTHHHGGISLARLRGPAGTPDVRYTLTFAQGRAVVAGRSRRAITINGSTPGPVLRAQQGDLVEVRLRNRNIRAGTTIHWHGIDVPNAEDGVAGVTQNAVLPGHTYVYRFRVPDAGTYWYHSHQQSNRQISLGAFGAFVVTPNDAPTNASAADVVAAVHTYAGRETINGRSGEQRVAVPAGQVTRVRFVNTDNAPKRVAASTRFRVAAIDGTEVSAPTPLPNTYVDVPAGGRVDLLVSGTSDVRVGVVGGPSLVVGPGTTRPDALAATRAFDPLRYGAPNGARTLGAPDRRFSYVVGMRSGFLNGHRGNWYSINGKLIPDVPMFMVRRDDTVQIAYVNRTASVHPMHLHGHHALVVSRDGQRSTGSQWWVDSLDVQPGERYVLQFRADNPGIWMFHCHNLPHVKQGLMTHLGYDGVRTPYRLGRVSKRLFNDPE